MTTQAYNGDEKLVFAIDLGTTMTAVSFAHLLHGVVPQVRVVSRWPFQEEATGNCKFPTVVRYNAAGIAMAFGAEALETQDDTNTTFLARWFKLHLHPKEMREENAIVAPPLPANVPLKRIYSDFLRYTFSHAKDFFINGALDGKTLWQRLGPHFELVFAIPNGWSGAQQSFLREATIAAGIVSPILADTRISFVSEAEASVHFAVERMNVAHLMQVGTVFAVLDAGGSTVDTTVYRCEAVAPALRLSEVTSSECVQAGSVFVDRAFEHEARVLLAGSKFGVNEHIQEIVEVFESKTKRRFTGTEEHVVVHFGRNSDNDKPRGIKMGRLTIPTESARQTFEPSLVAITGSLLRILQRARVPCETFILVGGFAESPYLRSALTSRLAARGLRFVFGDEPTTKAAAEGACSWRVKQYVSARASRCTYIVAMNAAYNPASSAHYERRNTTYVDASGDLLVRDVADVLVKKNVVVENDRPVSHSYLRIYDTEPRDLGDWTDEILVTNDENPGPWTTDAHGTLLPSLRSACTLRADLSGLRGRIRRAVNQAGKPYWTIEYKIEIFFGRTSLCAAVTWEENGVTKRGEVAVIPNSLI